jgi:hypothetical protein
MTGRGRLLLAAVATLGALLLAVVAVDALRWQQVLAGDDRRFRAVPASEHLWAPAAVLPFSSVERLLAVRDDVVYRHALRRYWTVRPGQAIFGAELETLRAKAEAELARLGGADREIRRRSAATNLLGVLMIAAQPPPQDPTERENLLRNATAAFRAAIELDATNDHAKLNLELALRDGGANQLGGDDPRGSAGEGQGSGAGRAGSGY